MKLSLSLLVTLAWQGASGALASLDCRPSGPIVPRPRSLASSPAFASAASNFTDTIERALRGDMKAGFETGNISFSLAIVSHSQPDPSVPLWEYHHLSPNNANGTRHLDRDSQYLIGSISKVISDAILLKSGVDLDDAVTKFLPVLGERDTPIDWKSISLRDLGDHLAGIPPNYGFSEYYFLKSLFELLGFPHIEDSEYPACGVINLNQGCDAEGLLNGLLEAYPVAPPSRNPVYSSISFSLSALALRDVTGKNYSQLLDEYLGQPLGLKNTGESPGEDSKAVIPPVDNNWGADYGLNAPGGGLYSSISDLSILSHAILSRSSALFPEAKEIDAWLKPHSSTGSANSLVGLPWEIFRTSDLTPNHPHVVDVYAKGGVAYGYRSQLAILDDYGIALILLTAGSSSALTPIYDAALTTFVAAVDEVSREEARQYTGTFTSGSTNDSVNATFELDDDSVVIRGISRNGSNILAGIEEIFAQVLGRSLGMTVSNPRLFPTDLHTTGTIKTADGTERPVIREEWRLWWGELSGFAESELPGAGLSGSDCLNWSMYDWMHYGKEPLDRFIFVRDADTDDLLGLELPFLRTGLLQRE